MEKEKQNFNEKHILEKLRHYLPTQAPLKDFIHHNTLHAFQDLPFQDALDQASTLFGYRVSLSMHEYRSFYKQGRIKEEALNRVLKKRKGTDLELWKKKMLLDYEPSRDYMPRVGQLRKNWKTLYNIDLDQEVQPFLFRLVCSYLDQGISIWNFPVPHKSFLAALRELQRNSFTGIFTGARCKALLYSNSCTIEHLLELLVGDPKLYEQYLFDQQFAHPGWSGMCAVLETQPESLLDKRKINLKEFIILELLLEIDTLDKKYKSNWAPLAFKLEKYPEAIFGRLRHDPYMELLHLWQEVYEWSYYDEVLRSMLDKKQQNTPVDTPSFQALFCIDDRECSLRRYLEQFDPNCETYSTAGFFGAEFFYQPEQGKFHTKSCPAPLNPGYLIKEVERRSKHKREAHFSKYSHNLFTGWLITQTLGFWSAFKLFLNVFKPSLGPASTSSFRHMDKFSKLTYQNNNPHYKQDGLQIGFSIEEMAQRVEEVLRSIGLVQHFASLIYVVGHGASSANNTHYAGYDCGACSGRPGSVNARVFCNMANHPKVRQILEERNIVIPKDSHFVAGLHDTTRDEIEFYDEALMPWLSVDEHLKHQFIFKKSLVHNARERARRFENINTRWSLRKIYRHIQLRSVSLFEPRPELNHATNSLCIIGRRALTRNLFLDRRAFLNSYDHRVDPEGKFLGNILKAVAPVCGGINLEYFFSRLDNQKLGAGSKLPHNVMGLIGVANGIDGDLRTGLPLQMIELHEPLRLMVIVEQHPALVLEVLNRDPVTREWFRNQWIHLCALVPETHELFLYEKEEFVPYLPAHGETPSLSKREDILKTRGNLPILQLN